MECPDCRYVLQPFDETCPRCARYGPPAPPPPPAPMYYPAPGRASDVPSLRPEQMSGLDAFMRTDWWILIALLCSPLNLVLGIIAMAACREEKAKRNAIYLFGGTLAFHALIVFVFFAWPMIAALFALGAAGSALR